MRRLHLLPREFTRRAPLLTWVAVLAVASLGLGIALGRATIDSSPVGAARPVPTPPPTISAPPTANAPTGVVDGVPEGFPETTEGALAAAVGFLDVEVSDLMARPDAYRAAWREMCTPTYFAQTGRAAAEAVIAGQESANHLISNAASSQPVYEHIFPLTAAVLETSGPTRTVQTWSLVVAHPGDGPTTVTFSAGTLVLRWWNGDWKLDGGSASSAAADGASGALRLDDGPALPRYLSQLAGVDDAPAR